MVTPTRMAVRAPGGGMAAPGGWWARKSGRRDRMAAEAVERVISRLRRAARVRAMVATRMPMGRFGFGFMGGLGQCSCCFGFAGPMMGERAESF